MARKVVVSLALVVAVIVFISSSAEASEGNTMRFGLFETSKVSEDTPPANEYKRPCNPTVQCRGRRLLGSTPIPQISSHGLQHRVGKGN